MENNTAGFLSSEENVFERMANLIAHTEISLQRSVTLTKTRETYFHEKAQKLDQQLHVISNEILHVRKVMTRTGAQQLREEAEKLSQYSQKEAKQLEHTYRQIKTLIATQCTQLNKASMSTVKNVAQLINTARKNPLKQFTEVHADDLQKNGQIRLQKMHRVISILHWRNLGMAILITLLASTVISLYVDNAWPWQAHQKILKERKIGKIVLNSWQQLSHNDQKIIIQNA